MQVRMEQAILAAYDRSRKAMFVPPRRAEENPAMRVGSSDSDINPLDGTPGASDLSVMCPGSATEHYDPLPPRERPSYRSPPLEPIGGPSVTESAAVQEADGRKPGDDQ